MGKWGKYKKTYKKSWENEPALNGWLMENPNASSDPEGREARCKVCECNFRAHHSDLIKHSQTAHHKANASKITKRQPQLTNMGFDVVSQEQKKIDICMAVHIAAHSAVRSIDHLCQILKDLGKGSSLENLKLHRTKCSKLIKNVIAPAMLTELVNDIGNEGFSLIVDESTEVSNKKYLAFVVRYYSKKKEKITNEFLGFVDVERATAQKLFDSTLEYLKTIGLKYENVIGIGTDGANNMCGIHNSYFTLFKEKVPTLQLVKCVCHSLHLCSSKASDELPSNLEFLVRETRNWFHDSPLRQTLYHTLYQTINEGKLPKKLVQLSKTRWLAWHKAICVIVDQWLELKTHFNAMALNRDEKCTKARILSETYNNDSNLLYFLFLKPITAEMNRANLNFQKESVEVTKLFSDLKVLLLTFARRILKPACINSINEGKFLSTADFESLAQALNNDSSYLHYDSVDYGYAFGNKVEYCDVSQETLQTIKQRCLRFLSVLCKQLVIRLPSNVNLFETLHYFNPDECLKTNQPCFSKLPHALIPPDVSSDALKMEWEKLIWINWTEHFNGTLPTDSESFWSQVKNVKNACGELTFENISRFALRTLSLPFSNAAVERVFSVMNAVKTKPRNRMHTDMLVAIMRVRMGLRATCCNNFTPSTNMYALFTSKMYTEKDEENAPSSSRDDPDELVETLTLYAGIDDD